MASVGLVCLVGACTPIPYLDEIAQPAPIAAPPPEPVVEADAPAPPPTAPPTALPSQPAPAAPLRTAVLLSDDIPEFSSIAREIELRSDAEHLVIYNLDGKLANLSGIRAEAAGVDQVIAIGLLAATVAREIESKRMVFCQVFNYRDYDLISATSKGIKLLPPFELQLERWTAIAPNLRTVGIIAGPNQDDLIAEIRAATASHGIDLIVSQVSSDKEALYEFKRFTPDIQGLWLLPDNRVLSPEVVREIMSYSANYRKQVLVFSRSLLSAGGLISFTSDAGDVAQQVLVLLDQMAAGGAPTGPDMRPLTQLRAEFNPEVARHLGLDISEPLLRAAQND
jgi:ABC-type uncharacterized transport system substrate-binding protein